MNPAFRRMIENNREALERLAEHGKTGLADDARRLLEKADAEAEGSE